VTAPQLFDAHCHLHHEPVASLWDEVLQQLRDIRVVGAVINGTEPADWDDVDTLAERHTWIVPAFGVHPWFLDGLPGDWKRTLRAHLERPGSIIGEIGIDRAHDPDDDNWERQESIFVWQLEEAARRNVPASIHCVRAWGRLLELMQLNDRPACGCLLHAYAGSAELVPQFAELGASFSFSVTTLQRKKVRQALAVVPVDRLMLETDAPYMTPPAELARYEMTFAYDSETNERFNHPGNLIAAYDSAAELLGISVEELAERAAANFHTLFGDSVERQRD